MKMEHCTVSNVTMLDTIANMYVPCKMEVLSGYWTHIYQAESKKYFSLFKILSENRLFLSYPSLSNGDCDTTPCLSPMYVMKTEDYGVLAVWSFCEIEKRWWLCPFKSSITGSSFLILYQIPKSRSNPYAMFHVSYLEVLMVVLRRWGDPLTVFHKNTKN